MPPEALSVDAYKPAEMAERVEQAGVAKAGLSASSLLTLALLAGAFISLGAAFSTVAVTDSTLSFGLTRVVAGVTFSLGLILVVIAGAELFTGNLLIVMAWASRRVTTIGLLRNWVLAYIGNLFGAMATAGVMYMAHAWTFGGGSVGATALKIAAAKAALPFGEALLLGVLCNALVCLAVWLCFSARSTTDKILSILFPITAFVAMGFEHSIANMYFIPMGLLLKAEPSVVAASGLSPAQLAPLTVSGYAANLIPVTIGNMIGGGVMVAAVYWFVYLRKK